MRAIVGGGAVHAETDVDARGAVFLDRGDAGSESHIRGRTVRHAAVVLRKDLDLLVVDPDRVRKPDVIPHPIDFLHVPNGAMTEFLQAELLFIFSFS